jgi:hypothetical protein
MNVEDIKSGKDLREYTSELIEMHPEKFEKMRNDEDRELHLKLKKCSYFLTEEEEKELEELNFALIESRLLHEKRAEYLHDYDKNVVYTEEKLKQLSELTNKIVNDILNT